MRNLSNLGEYSTGWGVSSTHYRNLFKPAWVDFETSPSVPDIALLTPSYTWAGVIKANVTWKKGFKRDPLVSFRAASFSFPKHSNEALGQAGGLPLQCFLRFNMANLGFPVLEDSQAQPPPGSGYYR